MTPRLAALRPRAAGFFAFRAKAGQEGLLRAAAEAFRRRGWRVLCVPALRAALGPLASAREPAALARDSSLLVSLGGDGTLLGAAVLGAPRRRPVLGINLGGLGYITAAAPEAVAGGGLEGLLDGACRIEVRRMARAEVLRGGRRVLRCEALNDVVLARPQVGRIALMRARVGGAFLAQFRADGLVFSTPTGSTAYNLSVGGPLVEPAAPVLVLSLISPHTLSNRPLVLPDDRVLEIEPGGDMELAVDGRRPAAVRAGDKVRLSRSPLDARLVFAPGHDPWAVLRGKLGWQGAPSADHRA